MLMISHDEYSYQEGFQSTSVAVNPIKYDMVPANWLIQVQSSDLDQIMESISR
jgi:hypothetical protein